MNLPINFIKGFADIVENFSTNYGKYQTVNQAKTAYHYDIEFLKKYYPIQNVDWSRVFRINMNMQVWLSNVDETDDWIYDITHSISKELGVDRNLIREKTNIKPEYPDICRDSLLVILKDYLCKDDLDKVSEKLNKRVEIYKNEIPDTFIDVLHMGFLNIIEDEYDIPNIIVSTAMNIPLLAELSKLSGFSFDKLNKRDEFIRTLIKNKNHTITDRGKENISF